MGTKNQRNGTNRSNIQQSNKNYPATPRPNPNSHPTGWNRIPTNWNDRQKEKNNARKQSANQRPGLAGFFHLVEETGLNPGLNRPGRNRFLPPEVEETGKNWKKV